MGIDGVARARAGMKTLRALLILGRVSNLPTVWSNCLCGWVLVRGTNMDAMVFGLLITGATLIYMGGMFLNDACDATWDREHRAERPIPAGTISEQAVWRIGIGLMAAGMIFLCLQGGVTALLSLMLFNTILVYNFVHKKITWSPLLIALCRWWLILIAAAFAHTALGVETAFRDAQEAGQAGAVRLCSGPQRAGQGGKHIGCGAVLALPPAAITSGSGAAHEWRNAMGAAGGGSGVVMGGALPAIHILDGTT